MRTGLGLAVVQKIEQPVESTTFAALIGAVVDALLGAAGIFAERESFVREDPFDSLKQIELRLHYDGFEIRNVDVTVTVRNALSDTLLKSFTEKARKSLFLDKDQVTVKQYVVQDAPYEMHVQALVLIG